MTEPVTETTADEALTEFTGELSDEALDAAAGEGRATCRNTSGCRQSV